MVLAAATEMLLYPLCQSMTGESYLVGPLPVHLALTTTARHLCLKYTARYAASRHAESWDAGDVAARRERSHNDPTLRPLPQLKLDGLLRLSAIPYGIALS